MEETQEVIKDTLIANLWYKLDYGLALSAFAEYKVIQQMGSNPMLLKKPDNLFENYGDVENTITGAFIKRYCNISNDEQYDQYKNFIAGSGTVWSYAECVKGTHGFFFGDMMPDTTNKVAWSTSFAATQMDGVVYEELVKIEKSLKTFSDISVRNSTDVGIFQNILKTNVKQMLDPVFLCDINEYVEIANTSSDAEFEPHIFSYVESGNKRIKKYVEAGLQIKSLDNKLYVNIERFVESSVELDMSPSEHIMVEDWLKAISESAFVVTDSYYGACFAIIFNKPFVVIATQDFRINNELEELLSWFELEERFVPCDIFHDMQDYVYLFRKNINYTRVNEKLNKLKNETRQWLENVLIRRENSDNEQS